MSWMFRHKQSFLIVAMLVAALASAVYTLQNRYVLRFIPLPLAWAETVNHDGWLLPSRQPASPMGRLDLPKNDITTEQGLRQALNRIQAISPTRTTTGMPSYAGITFSKWVKEITTKPFFCTDATQVFILTALSQGLSAREWHLLPPHWPPGQGHSVAEFYNPAVGRWQLVDAQHAAIIRGENGEITDMVSVLKAYRAGKLARIGIDYGPFREAMLNGMRGPSVGMYFLTMPCCGPPSCSCARRRGWPQYRRNSD